MIDRDLLEKAYKREGFYALQLEVGDRCEQNCIYCYMNAVPEEKNTLSDELIVSILDDCVDLGISAVEWLGGEPLLRNSIFDLMEHARNMGLKNNIWTGGLPLGEDDIVERCADLADNGLISVHVSTVDPSLYEKLHPGRTRRDLHTILDGVGKLIDIGYPADRMLNSVTYTGMQSAEDMIATMDYFTEEFRVQTSLNVYHTYLRPGQEKDDLGKFIPSSGSVARVYGRYSDMYGERFMPMNCVNKQYCSATLALLCDGSVTPCATIRWENAPNVHRHGSFASIVAAYRNDLNLHQFRIIENLPESCRTCFLSDRCFGCRSRAYAAGNGIYGKDPRCFR